MKKINRVLCLILALCLFALMALGSGSSDEGKDIVPNTEGNAAPNKDAEAEDTPTEEPQATEGSDLVTIDEQVLVDQDGVKITAKEYVED